MACLLSNGRALECRESIGGIRNIYFVNHNDMGAYTIDVDGELDDLGATSNAYKYELIFVEDNNINEATGFGDLYLAGAYNGLTTTGGNISRGKAYGDLSGTTIAMVGREQRAALSVVPSAVVADTIFGGLTTSGNRPTIVTV